MEAAKGASTSASSQQGSPAAAEAFQSSTSTSTSSASASHAQAAEEPSPGAGRATEEASSRREEEGASQRAEKQEAGESGGPSSSSSTAASSFSQFFSSSFKLPDLQGKTLMEVAGPWWANFREGLREASLDLFGMKEGSMGMKKHLYQQPPASEPGGKEGAEGAEKEAAAPEQYAGPQALVVVKESKKTWERLAERLKDAPIIQEILKAGTKLADTELGRQAGKLRSNLKDRVEDAREMWETSQNPLVYKLSSVWDDLTSETELGTALREIRRADPDFVLEDWVQTLSDKFLPVFFEAYLRGDLKALAPYLSEGMHRSLAEEFRQRKAEGLALDPHVLEISNTEVIQAKMHDHQPVLMVGALIQHINCVRNREGVVVEGKEDEVRASFYLLLFVRTYNETEGTLEWKVNERFLGFSQEYI